MAFSLKILISIFLLMVDARSALVAKAVSTTSQTTTTTTTAFTTEKLHRMTESVARGSNAVLTIALAGHDDKTPDSVHSIKCTVSLSGQVRNLGNWTGGGSRASVLRLTPTMQEIYGHRLTVSFQNKLVSISLANTTFSDSGIYACQSGNTKKSDIDLRVTDGPFIVSQSFPSDTETVTIKEGFAETFEMVVCGNPKPSLKWALGNDSATVKGVAVNSTHGYRSEHTSRKYSLETHCYKYTYQTPKVYREPCNLTATYQVHGDAVNPISNQVGISVSFVPEPVTEVLTKRMDHCMVTRWIGPLLNPKQCRLAIVYHVEVIRKNLPVAPILFRSYSNNFMFCQEDIGDSFNMDDVVSIRVRYANEFGHGAYVSTQFVQDFAKKVEIVSVVEPAQTNEDAANYKNIAITTSGLLGLFVVVIIVFITYYACANWNGGASSSSSGSLCCCCFGGASVEDGETADGGKRKSKLAKYTVTSKVGAQKNKKNEGLATPHTPGSKTPRKSRIRKETIIPKPKSLAQVTSHGLHKSHTFSGYDAFQNPHTGTGKGAAMDETLQKGYMPLNTLQRRISESLAAANAYTPQSTRVSSIPVFDDIFENQHAELEDPDVDELDEESEDEDFKRNSGASAETECTSLGSRTTIDIAGAGGHASLRHTHSLETVSDYDMPYVVDLSSATPVRRKTSVVDNIPRSQTFHGGARPTRYDATDGRQRDASVSAYGGSQYGSEYAHPSIALNNNNNSSSSSTLNQSDAEKRLSAYHTPRSSMLQLNTINTNDQSAKDNGDASPSKKSSFTDDKVIYDRPTNLITPSAVSSTPTTKSTNPDGFATPVISQITGLYDTPRIHPAPVFVTTNSNDDNESGDFNAPNNVPTPLNNTTSGGSTLEPPSRASSETLYDNINFILNKYGCSTDSDNSSPGTTAPASAIGYEDTNHYIDMNPKPASNIYDQLPSASSSPSSASNRPRRGTEC